MLDLIASVYDQLGVLALLVCFAITTSIIGYIIVNLLTKSKKKRDRVHITFVSTHRRYIQTESIIGAKHYIDRATHYISKMPRELVGGVLIRCANSDRSVISSTPHLKFTVSRPSYVYVCYNAESTPPKWLSSKAGWDLTNHKIHEVNMLGVDNDFKVFVKLVPRGPVLLHGNGLATHGYFVIVHPAHLPLSASNHVPL